VPWSLPNKDYIVYSTIPKSQEWLPINYVINIARLALPRFHIFRGKRLKDDYIKLCKSGTCMAMQSKAWITSFMYKKFLLFFKRFILGGISQIKCHLSIMDRHGSHVIVEAIEQVQEFGLKMVTLSSHTSHAL
jgi:hypothetical protein